METILHTFSFENGQLGKCTFSERAAKQLIMNALYGLRSVYEPTGWALKTPEKAFEALVDMGAAFVFVNDRIVCLSVSQPWFSDEYVATDEFVEYGIDTDTVVAVIKVVGKEMNLRRFTVGTRAVQGGRHNGLARHYQQSGLTVSTIELMGTIDVEENPQGGSQV